MQWNCLILYGTRIGKILMYYSSILDKAKPYLPSSWNCMLCLTAKYYILFSGPNLLNKRKDLVSKCRHENKYHLSNYQRASHHSSLLNCMIFS